MLTFDDARGDPNLYAAWLTRSADPPELADRARGILRDGGYNVGEAFAAALAGLPAVDLADFLAGNSPFETDDEAWLNYCRDTYAPVPHPSESTAERNGPRSSWRDRP
jgi:hypothetical protein